ncbi:hypothetical protein HON52_02910 [Candidatus Uhrbacteria bacterium]|nr:hypothetical protein [Candidatus Uhrbacteria bacterium]
MNKKTNRNTTRGAAGRVVVGVDLPDDQGEDGEEDAQGGHGVPGWNCTKRDGVV